MSYRPPSDILDVLGHIELDEALDPDDPRRIDTEEARGSQKTLTRLAKKLNIDLASGRAEPLTRKHVVLFGHRGSGKTTELRRYCESLSGPDRFLVIEVSIHEQLDKNNFQYPDLLMALAEAVALRLEVEKVAVDDDALDGLRRWFAEQIETRSAGREALGSVEAGAEARAGLPFIGGLFARVTTALRTNVTYKDELRMVLRNTYSQFSEAFNAFMRSAERAAESAGVGRRVLFLVDGTDKMSGQDTRRLFVEDVEQLLGIHANVVYTAPLAMKYEQVLTSGLDADLVLPMIKLNDFEGKPFAPGRDAARAILLARADRSLFTGDEVVEALADASGGHPRELLRLLKLCCEIAEGRQFDSTTVDEAVAALASEYRRFLEPADYDALAKVDGSAWHSGNDERIRRLLLNLALLEYNDGAWQRSHPAVRRLDAYKDAVRRRATETGSAGTG